MAFFKSKAEMYEARANRFEKEGKTQWAKAKNGEGNFRYGKAKKDFAEADRNRQIAKEVRKNGDVVFGRGKK